MAARFRAEPITGIPLLLPTLDDVLDAVEAGRLGAHDAVFDASRQAFVRVQDHPELCARWAERQRYRPPDGRRPLGDAPPDAALAFPALSDGGHTPAHGVRHDADLAARKAAWAAIKARHAAAEARTESLFTTTALVVAMLLIGLVGWSVLAFATGLGRVMSAGVLVP
jgi:hypothetical protein